MGKDGHPRRGGFLPALPDLPRRMFAAADISWSAPVLPGERASLRETITGIRRTDGRSGPLAFVHLDRVLEQGGEERVRETRTIVYRAPGASQPLPAAPADVPADAWCPGPLELFRFSAATFNAHRIHYDRSYARDEEGYPGLVVHGPFTACRLAEAAQADAGARLRRFAFRAQAPLFAGQPVTIAREGSTWQAVRCDGIAAMTAEAEA